MNTDKYKNLSEKELEEKRLKSRGHEKVVLNMILTE